jgi:hypothetical protein
MTEVGGFQYMLRARATKIGPWEKYTICFDTIQRSYSIKSQASGLWVSSEQNYGGIYYGLLRARAGSIGSWERFDGFNHEDVWNFRSRRNGLFVSAELGYSGADYALLRARANAAGPWETFGLLLLG